MFLHSPSTNGRVALVGALLFQASVGALAADVFAPPSAAFVAASEQEARIARLEEGLKKTLEKLDKAQAEGAGLDSVKLSSPLPTSLPPPPSKGITGARNVLEPTTPSATETDEERILGTMNDVEIYVVGGMVRKRAAKASMVHLPIAGAR